MTTARTLLATCVAPCVAAALWAALGVKAQTLTFRCQSDLVQLGDGKAAVLGKCGAPVLKDSFCKPLGKSPAPEGQRARTVVAPCETVDEWTFNPGYGQFMTTLRFESGRLVAISYGDRVK